MLSPRHASLFARLGVLSLVSITAFLLTAHYKLALPDDHPYGAQRNLGRQAWALSFKAGQATTPASNTAVDATLSNDREDYLDLDDYEDEVEWSSRRTDKWDPLSSSLGAPLTEITVKSCVVPPGLFDVCSPTTSAKEDALRGKWVRVDRDLNKQIGLYYLYIFYRRLLPGSSAPVITNLTILHHAPTSDDLGPGGTWVEVSESLRTGVWPRMAPAFLHYQITPQADVTAARKMSSSSSAGELEPIRELDVIYGGQEVNPLLGYTKISSMITGGDDDEKRAIAGGTRVGSALALRKGVHKVTKAPTSRFSAEGNFTILQIADLHFSVGPGQCRDMDTEREAECKKAGADVYTLRWLKTALEEVKPDLVVLSGDQLNGQGTSWSAQSTIMKWAPLLYERGIPWTTIFGNHDEEETDLTSSEQVTLMKSLPYYVGEVGPAGVDGASNYVRSIRANDSDTVLSTLYFLDSHSYAKKLKPWGDKTYDSIKANQINWFRGRSSQVKTYKRPYTPTAPVRRPKTKKPSSKRPGSRPGSKRPPPPQEDLLHDHRLRARQADEDEEGMMDRPEVEQDLDAVREELAEEASELADEVDGGIGIGNTMMPDDGSNVKDVDDLVVEFEESPKSSASSTSTSTSTSSAAASSSSSSKVKEVDSDEKDGQELNALLEEEEYDVTPTKMEAGPTRSAPLVAKPNAIVFFHIPLQESYTALMDVGANGKLLLVGDRYEGNGASKTNSGFFEQGILAQGELISASGDGPIDEFWDGESGNPTEGRPEVKVIANGHCHITEDCRRVKGTWLCFGGGASYSGYGRSDFARRVRVYELSEFGERIETYKLLDTLERIDRSALVGEDALGL